MNKAHTLFATLTLTASLTGGAHAALLAEYNFNDGTANNSAATGVNYDLTAVGGGATLSGGVATFDGNNTSYLQNTFHNSGEPDFTVSLWVKASTINQGSFKGIFSNESGGSGTDFSWQLDNSGGNTRAVSKDGVSINAGGVQEADVWQNLVVRKVSSTAAELWVDGQLVGTDSNNLGGLQKFRIAINRASDHQFAGDYDKIQIWDSLENVGNIYAAGHLNATHSWVAGRGGDVGGDATWHALTGGVNLALSSGSEPLINTGLGPVPYAYASSAGTGGASDAVFGGSDDVTFETIIRVHDLTGDFLIYDIGGNGTGTALTLADNVLSLTTQSGSSANSMTVSTGLDASHVDEWLHIVGVITEPGDGTGTLKLYLNGQLVGDDAIASLYNGWAGGNSWGLGTIAVNAAGDPVVDGAFDGDIALFNHYDFALTATEVYDQFRFTGIPAPAALPTGLAMLGLAAARRRTGRR